MTTTDAHPPSASSIDTNIHAEKILILDFGSQYTQLIARRVREVGVYCEIRAFDLDEAAALLAVSNGGGGLLATESLYTLLLTHIL